MHNHLNVPVLPILATYPSGYNHYSPKFILPVNFYSHIDKLSGFNNMYANICRCGRDEEICIFQKQRASMQTKAQLGFYRREFRGAHTHCFFVWSNIHVKLVRRAQYCTYAPEKPSANVGQTQCQRNCGRCGGEFHQFSVLRLKHIYVHICSVSDRVHRAAVQLDF